jgi:hypothetical protein
MSEDYSNCGTGCRDPKHMQKCLKCGAEYHIGLLHQCSTNARINPLHAHCSWFGSELACSICNPVCHQNHQMDNPNHLNWCGHPDCPVNPKKFKKVEISPQLREELDAWERASTGTWEETEDGLRKSKRKTIRNQGKYKGRGKEKRREP